MSAWPGVRATLPANLQESRASEFEARARKQIDAIRAAGDFRGARAQPSRPARNFSSAS